MQVINICRPAEKKWTDISGIAQIASSEAATKSVKNIVLKIVMIGTFWE